RAVHSFPPRRSSELGHAGRWTGQRIVLQPARLAGLASIEFIQGSQRSPVRQCPSEREGKWRAVFPCKAECKLQPTKENKGIPDFPQGSVWWRLDRSAP